jgi:hypothetical protein
VVHDLPCGAESDARPRGRKDFIHEGIGTILFGSDEPMIFHVGKDPAVPLAIFTDNLSCFSIHGSSPDTVDQSFTPAIERKGLDHLLGHR